jgi:hypothetical protein
MKSSFKKAVKTASGDIDSSSTPTTSKVLGFKPSSVGLGVISSGHREFDAILGGGYPLGTMMILWSDSYSDYATSIMRYAVAEGVAMKHRVVLVHANMDDADRSSDLDSIVDSLPYNMSASSEKAVADADEAVSSASSSELKIAWQYGKYLPSAEGSSGGGKNISRALGW